MENLVQYSFTKHLRPATREDFLEGVNVISRTYYLKSPNTGAFEGPYILWPGFSDLKQFGRYMKDGVVWVDVEI
jgi:hypothetical protein